MKKEERGSVSDSLKMKISNCGEDERNKQIIIYSIVVKLKCFNFL
jgi:hypothetical protein